MKRNNFSNQNNMIGSINNMIDDRQRRFGNTNYLDSRGTDNIALNYNQSYNPGFNQANYRPNLYTNYPPQNVYQNYMPHYYSNFPPQNMYQNYPPQNFMQNYSSIPSFSNNFTAFSEGSNPKLYAPQSKKNSKSRVTNFYESDSLNSCPTEFCQDSSSFYTRMAIPGIKLNNYDNYNYFDIEEEEADLNQNYGGECEDDNKVPEIEDEGDLNHKLKDIANKIPYEKSINNSTSTSNNIIFNDFLINKEEVPFSSPKNKIEKETTPSMVESNNKIIMSHPSTVFTFKADTNNSTINKIITSTQNKNYSGSSSNLSNLKNFFPSKKHYLRESDKQKSVVSSKQNAILGNGSEGKFMSLELEDIIGEGLEFENFNIEKQNSKNKKIFDSLLSFPFHLIIKHDRLNPVQEKCFDLLVNTDFNSVITAPTGSGKTVLFELAIGRVINKFFDQNLNKFINTNFKIVYLAPIKSLCQEKFFDWKMKFSQPPFCLSVIEATGDSEFLNLTQLFNANIILSTPERWDIITRKWKEYPHLISSLVLFLIDEVHLLNEDQRGATLEAIIARMKLISSLSQFRNSSFKDYRTIALSATIPNIDELADFLQVDQKKGMLNFGEEYRPVKIEKLVFGYNNAKNEYLFEKYLNYRLADLIVKYSDNRPSLVFCQTQKGTINAANQLLVDIAKFNYSSGSVLSNADKSLLNSLSQRIKDKNLSNLIRNGLAFHNAGLCIEDRQLVEEHFKKGLVKVICTTSTLAQGVNLPARLVIIKSTSCYRGPKAGFIEYSKMEIDQMIGRAGRPQYDTKGIAIIMTEKSNVDKYLNLTSENVAIESHLEDYIIEHINAEIAQGTILDVDSAIGWIKNSFMYIRMKHNPEKYNIRKQLTNDTAKVIDVYLQKLCVKIFNNLKNVELITVTNDEGVNNSGENSVNEKGVENFTGMKATSTDLGKKMCKNYVYYETLKTISNMSSNTEEHILDILSNSHEFSKYHSKMDERKTLNHFNKEENSIKYKVKGPIDTPSKKSFILLQVALSGLNIEQWELRRQQNEIINSSVRILNCIKEYFKVKNDAKGYINSLILRKSLLQRMWSDSDLLMKQLPKIGEKIAKNFVRAGLISFDKVLKENPRKLEAVAGKNTPFGNVIIDIIKSIPVIEFKYDILKNYKNTYKLSMNFNLPWRKYIHQEDFDPFTTYHAIVAESSTNKLHFKKKLKPMTYNKMLMFNIPSLSQDNFPLSVYLFCDKFFGLDKVHLISGISDKTGVVSNSISSTGQITLFQMYDRIQAACKKPQEKPEEKSVDEQIANIIQNELSNMINPEEESEAEKTLAKKKEKKEVKPKKKMKKEKMNFDQSIDKSPKSRKSEAQINPLAQVNSFIVSETANKSEANFSPQAKSNKIGKLSYIQSYSNSVSQNKKQQQASNCDNSNVNLDFLDNYQFSHTRRKKEEEDKVNDPFSKKNNNKFALNFEDFL